VSGGIVYVPNGRIQPEGSGFTVSAFNLANGVKRWTAADVGDDVHTTPAVGDARVYIGAIDGSVHAIDARTGKLRWIADLVHEIWSSPALANGVLYIATESSLVALDAATGAALYSDDLDTGGSAEMTSPAIADGRIYVGSGNSLMAFGLP
jgi:outer membrane protein assembly factor BamB